MTVLRRLLPDGIAGRFALLLAVALIAANLIALALLTLERGRLDRAALIEREVERIVSFVPAIEAADPSLRRAIAREASTRFSRVSVDPDPVVTDLPDAPRSIALTRDLGEALGDRTVRAAVLVRQARDARRSQESIAVSIRLTVAGEGPEQWLNVMSRGDRPQPPGLDEEVFLILLGLSLLAVLAVSLLFLRRLTRPLSALADAARAAGTGDRTARVPETGPREMREAAAAFNDMQARIARFDAERMRTLAAVGHDLRTPLTSLRIRAELLDEHEGAPMVRTLDEMTVMADGLVAYAKGAGDAETSKTVSVGDLMRRICDERGASLDDAPPVAATLRPVAFGRAIGNLIDNAIRYGGGAHVTVRSEKERAIITVQDDGPGIPEDRLDAMLEPFVRGDDSRSQDTGGAGLGLSIARSIIVAHGGELILENRAGGGLKATVILPTTG